jgi:hypothetical protein
MTRILLEKFSTAQIYGSDNEEIQVNSKKPTAKDAKDAK